MLWGQMQAINASASDKTETEMLWDQFQVISESVHNTTGNFHFKTLKTNNSIQYFSSLALVIIDVDP